MADRIVADLFCGLGGTSTGVIRAAREKGLDIELYAINHWPTAIATHKRNHPWAHHLCENLDNLNPKTVIPGGHLHLMVASPECTHHSRARGGKPIHDQSRATAWHVLRWADALRVDNIFIENVPEFMDWGPLYPEDHPDETLRNKPIPELKGKIFLSFIEQLKSLNYQVDYKTVVCANFGDATSRERLFIIARKGDEPIIWPEPTHSKEPRQDLFGSTKKWRAAREIIDWEVKGQSIFNRKRPLSENTMRRIMKGLKKFSKLPIAGEPFIVKLYGTNDASSIDNPLPTITAGGQHLGLAQPFLTEYHGASYEGGERVKSVEDPLATIDTSNRHALVEPFVVAVNHGKDDSRAYHLDNPMPTITSVDAWGIAEPYLLPNEGIHRGNAPRSLEEPLNTITASRGAGGLVEPFLIGAGGPEGQNRNPKSVDDPLTTILTDDHHAMAEPYIIGQMSGSAPRTVADPLPTITTTARDVGLAEPFLVKYYDTGSAVSIEEPLDTITTRDRFALAVPLDDGIAIVDILYRMLTPHELAAATGFDGDYVIEGTREEQVKQIGNAVPVYTAEAHVSQLL